MSAWDQILRNDFQPGIEALHPTIRQVREVLEVQGALYSQMTGTGSACFGLFPSEESALKACKVVRTNGWTAYAARANR